MKRLTIYLCDYGLESFIFDIAGLCFILLFRKLIAHGDLIAGTFPPVIAALLVDAAFLMIALQMRGLFRVAAEGDSEFFRLVLSGGYALMTIAQPVLVTAMLRRYGALPNEPFTLIAFFVGNALIFPALLGAGEDSIKETLKYLGISLAAGFLFFGGFNIHPTGESFAILGLSLGIVLLFVGISCPGTRPGMERLAVIGRRLFQEHRAGRLLLSLITTFLLWTWWELAIDSIGDSMPRMTLGDRLMILYFTGPLLYRLSLMLTPPVIGLRIAVGILVFVAALLY